jgi:large subunit ribosomal protein L14e
MVFTRFVEVGRVALINYGPDLGKLCVILDIVDQKRVLIDGPGQDGPVGARDVVGVHRQVISCKRLSLTDLVLPNLPRSAKKKNIIAAWEAGDITSKWENTNWAKKLAAKKRRAALTDFDRFKVMIAKKQKSKLIAEKINDLA